ncbi:MAG TPA: hypothetical protein VKV15_18190 [Bryobacteraceae bacterium]|nr:hypothetical protein [Bryobacteraceae bacterium]
MRSALETRLKGIRWETRLAERHKHLSEKDRKSFDCEIFDGHILILDFINLALIVGIIFSGWNGHSDVANSAVRMFRDWGKLGVILLSLLPPVCILIMSVRTLKKLDRGNITEGEHLQSWHNLIKDGRGKKVFEAEPPRDAEAWQKILDEAYRSSR